MPACTSGHVTLDQCKIQAEEQLHEYSTGSPDLCKLHVVKIELFLFLLHCSLNDRQVRDW